GCVPPSNRKAEAGGQDVLVTLDSAAAAHGRAVHADGTPFTAFTVNGRPVKQDNGEFTSTRDTDGTLHIVVGADGVAPSSLDVDVKRGTTKEVGDVVLGAGRTITGHVVEAGSG